MSDVAIRKIDARSLWPAAVVLGAGELGVALFASQNNSSWRMLGFSTAVALAAVAVGVFLGFLFGVPRAAGASTDPAPAVGRLYLGNTNLEQVSDWLTKIIIGVTLTQFATIRTSAGQMFAGLAPGFGGQTEAAAMAAATVVYFTVVGFIIGWLLTRLLLGAALTSADQAAEEAARQAERLAVKAQEVDAAGDADQADELRHRAAELSAAASILTDAGLQAGADAGARRFEIWRRDHEAGRSRSRTQVMEQLVSSARRSAANLGITREAAVDLFRTGRDGDRTLALAYMQGSPDAFDLQVVVDALSHPRTAFEQLQALRAVESRLHRLPPNLQPDTGDIAHLLMEQLGNGRLPPGDRRTLAQRLLHQIERA